MNMKLDIVGADQDFPVLAFKASLLILVNPAFFFTIKITLFDKPPFQVLQYFVVTKG